jgi:hypothetical protein
MTWRRGVPAIPAPGPDLWPRTTMLHAQRHAYERSRSGDALMLRECWRGLARRIPYACVEAAAEGRPPSEWCPLLAPRLLMLR